MIDIISATRLSEDEFWERSALGISLRRMQGDPRLSSRICYSNHRGLPELYNHCIHADNSEEILVFVHDDVWMDDYLLADRIIDGLKQYDIIGVAGNRRRVSRQPSWCFVDIDFTWDERPHLSGAMGHGQQPFGEVNYFGATPAPCELLDGVFLAARTATLREHKVLFDPRFDFHFYDLDFCRTARQAALRLGTWPISMTHQSGGGFGNAAWRRGYDVYLEKWID